MKNLTWCSRALGLILLLTLLSACKVETTVRINLDKTNAGTILVDVQLDSVAAEKAGDLSAVLAVDDLTADGWTVVIDPPNDVGQHVRASVSFEGEKELTRRLATIGSGPMLDDAKISRHHKLGENSYGLSVDVQPPDDVNVFSDTDVAALFDGNFFGKELSAQEQKELEDAGVFSLEFRVPGEDVKAAGSASSVRGKVAHWDFTFGGEPFQAMATGRDTNEKLLPTLLGAVLLFLLAVLVLLMRVIFVRRHRRQRRDEDTHAAHDR